MRRICCLFLTIAALAAAAPAVWAGEGRVLKVLPQFLDDKGQQALSPSLYERDAYQAYLRKYPTKRAALRLAVQWKAKDVDWSKTKLRVEMRGLTGNVLHTVTIEQPVKKTGWFSSWSEARISGDEFKTFGELTAWRVTLWEGDTQLSELESFMWSAGVQARR